MPNANNPRPVALIYRDTLLPVSETFIVAQANALIKYQPFFVGARGESGLQLPPDRTVVLSRGGLIGRIQEIAFKQYGIMSSAFNNLAEHSPALLHAHFGPDAVHATPIVRKLKIPFVATFHGFDATTTDSEFQKSHFGRRYLRKRQAVGREAKILIAVSEYIKRKLVDQGMPQSKIRVHYIGVDTSVFSPENNLRREQMVVFVGRLVEKKGCEYLIRAMASVQNECPAIELVVIGDGPMKPTLEALAAKSLRRFQFMGSQPSSTVKHYLSRAKILCVPSVVAATGDAEGFGMVFAEAQAMGTPVVSFASGGIPEAVEHGVTGLLAAEKDWGTLSQHLALLMSCDELWTRFSNAGVERVHKLFDLKNQTAALEQIYDEIASTAPKVQVPECL